MRALAKKTGRKDRLDGRGRGQHRDKRDTDQDRRSDLPECALLAARFRLLLLKHALFFLSTLRGNATNMQNLKTLARLCAVCKVQF